MKTGVKFSAMSMFGPLYNAFALVGQTYAVTLIGLLIGILSARGLTVADRGYLALFLLLTQLLSRLGSLGFEQIIQRQGVVYPLRQFYLYSLIGSFVLGILLLTVMRPLQISISSILVMMVVSFLVSVLRVNISILIYKELIKKIFLINLTQAVLQLFLYAIIFNTRDVNYFLGAWVITVSSACLLSAYIVTQAIDDSSTKGKTPKQNLFISGYSYFGVVLPEIAISFCLELPIIRHVLGLQAAGLYAVSNTMTGIFYQVSVAISAIMAKGNLKINKLVVYSGLGVFGLIFAFVSYWLLPLLFGVGYTGALKFLFVILPAVWVLGILRIEQMSTSVAPKLQTQFILTIILIFGLIISSNLPPYLVKYGISFTYLAYALISLFILWRYNKNLAEVDNVKSR